MNDEQKAFLESKLDSLSELQPAILQLRERLLAIDGQQLVAPVNPDPDLKAVLDRGVLQELPVVLSELEANACHWNVAALWLQKRLLAIGTGYALSDDDLWRQHTWGISADGIIETTEVRTYYFGLRLHGKEADSFASQYFDT